MPNFASMPLSWKEMVLQVPEAQVVAAPSTRRKMLNTSEVVKSKVGPLFPRGGPTPSLVSKLGSSVGSGGGNRIPSA